MGDQKDRVRTSDPNAAISGGLGVGLGGHYHPGDSRRIKVSGAPKRRQRQLDQKKPRRSGGKVKVRTVQSCGLYKTHVNPRLARRQLPTINHSLAVLGY